MRVYEQFCIFKNAQIGFKRLQSQIDISIKVTANILRCLGHGCPLGWLIDPKDRSVLVFFGDRPPVVFSESSPEYLPVPEFAASFELSVQALFSWLWE